jgi:hypothetical protein
MYVRMFVRMVCAADLPPPSSAKLPLKQVGISLDLFRLRQYMLDELMSELKRFEENSKMYKPEV